MSAGASFPRFALRSQRLMAGCVFLIVGVVFVTISGFSLYDERRAHDVRRPPDAVVVTKGLRRATADTSAAYEITYRISAPGENAFERTEIVPIRTWEALEPGAVIATGYVPGRPESARIPRESAELPLAVFVAVGAAVTVCGGWLVVGGLRAVVGQLRLSRAARVVGSDRHRSARNEHRDQRSGRTPSSK